MVASLLLPWHFPAFRKKKLCHIVYTVSQQNAELQPLRDMNFVQQQQPVVSCCGFLQPPSRQSATDLGGWNFCSVCRPKLVAGSSSSGDISPRLTSPPLSSGCSGPCLGLNEEGNLPWIMNGDLCVLWCEHLSGTHYAPIRTDHGFQGVKPASAFLSVLCLRQTMLKSFHVGLLFWKKAHL